MNELSTECLIKNWLLYSDIYTINVGVSQSVILVQPKLNRDAYMYKDFRQR